MHEHALDDEPCLMTSKQAAAHLNISTRKLWTLTNSNKLPAIRIGRCVRYDSQDLRVFIDKNRGKVRS
jgi:excisionase family DNA binding protein